MIISIIRRLNDDSAWRNCWKLVGTRWKMLWASSSPLYISSFIILNKSYLFSIANVLEARGNQVEDVLGVVIAPNVLDVVSLYMHLHNKTLDPTGYCSSFGYFAVEYKEYLQFVLKFVISWFMLIYTKNPQWYALQLYKK
ncbi:hypothetical protein YC2023_077763 [Brassica napus]